MRGEYDSPLDIQEKLFEATQQDTRVDFQNPKSRLQKFDSLVIFSKT